MGNATAIRSFALSGGAAGSLVGAVLVVLVVLGAILAFDGDDRSASGTVAQSVAIQGAPEAAARSVRPATRAVARTPRPIPEPAATAPPATIAAPAPPFSIDPLAPLPPPDVTPIRDPLPTPDPSAPDCIAGSLLPQCVPNPNLPPAGHVVGNLAGGLDAATQRLLGVNLGLGQATAPLGQLLDDPAAGLGETVNRLRPGLRKTADRAAAGLDRTLTGRGSLRQDRR